MRIIVVCGAGASSTFVATRLRRAADAAGVALDATALPLASVAREIDRADTLLIGAHVGQAASDIRQHARDNHVRVVDLPSDIITDRDGSRTLALVTDPGSAIPGGHR